MHNIHDLEKRWLHYKIKKLLPYFILLIVTTIAISIYLVSSFNISSILPVPIKEEKKVIHKEKVITQPIVKQIKTPKTPNKEVIVQEKEKLTLTPSMDFIKKLRNNSSHSYTEPTQVILPVKEIKQENTPPKTSQVKQVTPDKKKNILIKRQETQSDIAHVIKRFQKNNNPALSLFVAKKYYKLGNYSQAHNYALITNEINNEIDASWIIFAKSLYKLNQKTKAKKILKRYIKHSHSANAKVLLDDMKSGKFQ